METLVHLVPLFKILAAFFCMLVGIRMRLGLGTSILTGAAVTGLLFGLPLGQWPGAVASAASNEKTLFLAAIIVFIMMLSGLLEKTGQSARLMQALSAYLRSPRFKLAFFPALIGLLPMPGGAIFSAPMLEEASKDMGLNPTEKVLVNYWYRHIWELAWPLYPGIILTASLGGVPIHHLVAYTWLGLPLSILLGWIFILRHIKPTAAAASAAAAEDKRDWRVTAREGLPLLVSILGAVFFEIGIGMYMPEVAFEWGVLLALAAGIACCMAQNKAPMSLLRKILFTKHLGSMVYVVLAIFVFKEFMQASGVVAQLARLAGGGVALMVSAVCLPFLVGLIAGLNVAFVGATFPLLLALLHQLGMDDQVLPYLTLAQFAGYAGLILSPLHICYLLTCEFFHVNFWTPWRKLMVPGMLIMVFGVVYFMLLTR
ncbi:DUF401 family protein [Desulfocurvus sp. DL9XJH121]